METKAFDFDTDAGWGYPNFGVATKAHLFKQGKDKSACGKYERESVIVLTPRDDVLGWDGLCKTCHGRAAR